MKLHRITVTRLSRVVKAGATLGAAILAASALQAQSPSQTPPPDQNPQTPAQVQPQNPNTSAQAPETETGKVSHRAKEFLESASQANQSEIAMGNVAEQKSQNSQVKSLAQMIITDHQQNLGQVQALAQAHAVTLDSSLSWMNQHEVNRLQKANDADFDKEFTKQMVKDHVQCIKKFDKAVADIQEPDIKQYAQSTLPALRSHLRKSEEAARAAGVDQSTISSYMKELPAEEPERGVTLNQ